MDEANPKTGKRAPRKTAPAKAKAPAPRAPRAPRAASSQAVAPAAAPRPENGKAAVARLSPEERHRLIAEAAYFRASRRGFDGAAEVEDWLAAEAEIDGKLLGNSEPGYPAKRTR